MTAVREAPPENRYGRSADQRADRKLTIIGSVLGVVLLGVVGWIGYAYITGQGISAEVIKRQVVSDARVDVHLEVRKDKDAKGYCTLRAQHEDGSEVARKDFRFDDRTDRVDRVLSLRTTSRATSVELLGCTTDGGAAR
ncbi:MULTISPECIES: DUF4307 domain-containing protein [unclassified Streptomyces]|uniref:DUF4307 domain-containing protein n=1 Tax=unclassified Streptomyces TaxID=2593676 RepID=UPI0022570260|nr:MULTISPECIES: DUF4307 domain-containing protein [unclassified Streptomyces]WSP57145.1 DUF4307 domain-containing protein [Streptomyces sp. NBC_01241]WSU22137.1 DUF4307 domain-containing protein [Streptomyces sp. NBC_01108]MCX4788951.1 DUF4307 domain-containing protein [Streptomyces sp. NBC_01221]MCX4795304.1 DUF4307 domain-containing protein [Streptomyces sp. NBC_01242]WSJ36611.1 DUF4307 domain-containing protein [Streptomyces sp. NBC_01321]